MSQDDAITVLFLNRHGPDLIDYLECGLEGAPVRLMIPPDAERSSLLAMVPDADVLIGWGSDLELLEAATRLKLFINPGTGITQHIENFRTLCQTREVALANGHGNSYAVAQHTVALLLALTNKVIPHHRRMTDAATLEGSHGTTYMNGITVGFLGYGAINKKVHRFLSGFDVSFAACRRRWGGDPGPYPTDIEKFSVDQMHDFYAASDIVINALPTTSQTRDVVTLKELSLLGPKGLFVNVGRAATVVQDDIYKALKERIIAGAALEVWWGRKKDGASSSERNDPFQHPFHELDNLVMSPHRGADSGGDLRRWDEVIENLRRVQAGRTDYLNLVDLDSEY